MSGVSFLNSKYRSRTLLLDRVEIVYCRGNRYTYVEECCILGSVSVLGGVMTVLFADRFDGILLRVSLYDCMNLSGDLDWNCPEIAQ